MFKIGQKVVCVNDSNQNNPTVVIKDNVMKGEIYTVRCFDNSKTNAPCFEEIVGGYYFDGTEAGFRESRFRPICESETFAEETLKNIAEQIEQEQLVLI